ncbi:endophilin-A-like isoform X7 [Portunus trituberculatus]|uniref:endophilin-A-like isoform X7 n=1 Tax=Portunus trituberculatus TaxID=210409 RepID=UPI001E1CD285|nr:endophilin-A-like isoform X7 [Portunus trituberculatus]XP_045135109.1 endophilin-A-like isoform X7 [Portunus trituberculatus]
MAFSGFAGLKKQFNKANQFMNEKIGGVEGTKLDHDFFEMEAKTDVMCELVDDLQIKTKEFLHPNPASRAKMSAVKGIGKLSGQAKASTYPQPEGVLGEAMVGHGKKLGEESYYGMALIETGESMKQIADIKYNLDDNMKMNFLEPLHTLSTKDIKEVQHHRKKLQGRRLDFDCKKRKKDKALSTSPSGSPARSPGWGAGSHVTDEEIKMAEDKFAESLQLAQMGMHNLLENDVEQISQLATFADNLLDYHKQCCEILDVLVSTLNEKKDEAATRPKQDFVPKTLSDLGVADTLNGGLPSTNVSATTPQRSPYGSPARSPVHTPTHTPQYPASPLPSPMKSPARSPMLQTPSAVALYDFEPENPGELGFSEGDNITLTQRIDENWFEGSLNGKTGLFPVSYVNVTVPLP